MSPEQLFGFTFATAAGLEKTTRSPLHHVAQHRPTGSETTLYYAPRSSRFGSEPPSVEDNVDIWRYAIMSCMPEMTTTAAGNNPSGLLINRKSHQIANLHHNSQVLKSYNTGSTLCVMLCGSHSPVG